MIIMMSASIPLLNLIAATTLISITFCHGINSHGQCIPRESEALLEFKRGLSDSSNKLKSWDGELDCCSWYGVICDNLTGRVLELRLQGITEDYFLSPESAVNISESLLELKHLQYLDLSNNYFIGTSIPKFLGFMSSLRFLNLSKAGFEGLIPHQLGNLSNLECLIIESDTHSSSDVPQGFSDLYVERLDWVSRLSSLKFLDLSSVNLSKASDWLDSISRLPSLEKLHLSGCELARIPPVSNLSFSSLSVLRLSRNHFYGPVPAFLQNLTLLTRLDLSGNPFNSSIPDWFGCFARLELLRLHRTKLEGKIPTAIGHLTSLKTLDLSYNHLLEGGIPMSFRSLCSLRSMSLSHTRLSQEANELIEILSKCASYSLESLDLSDSMFAGYLSNHLEKFKNLVSLDLSANLITGPVPVSFGEMASLTSLDLSSNSLEGEVSEIHFQNLRSLVHFDASGNHLILRVNPDWIPPFHLVRKLYLRSWDVGPMFPTWLRHLNHLKYLDLSNSKISSTLPTWFHNFSSNLYQFNLSHNQMYGVIHNLSNDVSFYPNFIDLSSNYFEGPLPYMSHSPQWIDLSNNTFSGSIHKFVCNEIQHITETVILNENHLQGEIPDCWMYWVFLAVLELSNNNFSSNIPPSIGNLTDLVMLSLHNNNLIGELPSTLQYCNGLFILDSSENELSGEIPSWIGEHLQELKILNLRGNKFHGHMPKALCNLTELRILDLADNCLNGSIPTCLGSMTGMSTKFFYIPRILSFAFVYGPNYVGSSSIVKKGEMVQYSTILRFVQSLDLSNNKFVGKIPEGITRLSGLQSLNLSYNFLTGGIPEDIGAMVTLESLDLSENRLSGEIPRSISSLTFLSSLNLSNNNLSGPIPLGTQLQSMNASSFIGNNLCGLPLSKECRTKEAAAPGSTEGRGGQSDETEAADRFHFYASLAPGFVVGFWCVMGPLVFNKRWRILYFNFLELWWDKIWVWFHLHVVRFVRSRGF